MFEEEVNELKIHLDEAHKRRDSGEYKEAIEALYKALDVDKRNLDAHIQLAEIFLLLNDFERALKYYKCANEIVPDNLNIISSLYATAYRAGLYRDALEYAKWALEKEKSDKNYSMLIKILDKFGDIKSVKELLNEPYLSDCVLFEIVEVLVKHAFCADAENVLNKISDSQYKIASEVLINFNKGQNDKIRPLIEDLNIDNDEIYNIKGLIYTDDLNFSDAIKYFISAINLKPDEPKYFFNLANAYFYNGWVKEAENAYRKAISMDLDNADYRFALANMFFEISEFIKAKQEVENILKTEPEHLNTKVLKALLKAHDKDFIGAKEDLENILLQSPDNNFINISLGKILIELGDFVKAEDLLLNVISKEKDNLYALTVFAKLLLAQKRQNDALEMVESILNKNSYYMDAFCVGMQAALELDDFITVKKYASDAISIDTNYAPAYYYLAVINNRENDFEEAVECMKRAILFDLNNSEYYIQMAKMYEKTDDIKSALEYASEAVSIEPDNTEIMLYFSALAKKNRNICQKK